MTIEVILLMAISLFVTLGAFLGSSGPQATFKSSGPRLGARIERNVSTGSGFSNLPASGWSQPPEAPPTGEMK